MGRAHAVYEDTFHGLSTEVLGAGLGLFVQVLSNEHTHSWFRPSLIDMAIRDFDMLLDEHSRLRCGRCECRCLQHWRGSTYLTKFHRDRTHARGATAHGGKYRHFLGGLVCRVQGVRGLRDG